MSEGDVNAEVELLLIVEGYEYNITSKKLTEAIKHCIKIVKYLGIDFAVECKHIWSFLIDYLCGISSGIKVYASVTNLTKDIDELKDAVKKQMSLN